MPTIIGINAGVASGLYNACEDPPIDWIGALKPPTIGDNIGF